MAIARLARHVGLSCQDTIRVAMTVGR